VYGKLADWRKRCERNSNQKIEIADKPGDEIARLIKENAELKKANSILKDALGFFVEDRKR